MAEQVTGVREAVRELRQVDSKMASAAIKRIKAPAEPAVRELRIQIRTVGA